MAGERVPVAVAVVSWNTRALLLRCLDSLAGDAQRGCAEVWVIDNASNDGSAQAAREHAPWAHVIDAGANLGFGSAVNLAAGQSSGEWLLAANADIALQPGALQALLAAGADPRVGCVAPRLLLPAGDTQHSVHPFPTVALTLAFNLGLPRLSAPAAERMCLEGFWDPDRSRIVPWAIGACLLLRRSAFDSVGGFDQRHWMYAEDLDLAWRLHQRGFLTRYEPGAHVLHESGAAARAAFGGERAGRFMGETYVMLRRRRGALYMSLVAAINVVGAATRAAWYTALSLVSRNARSAGSESRRWLRAHVGGVRFACDEGRRR